MDEFVRQGQWLAVPVTTFVLAALGSLWGSRLGKVTEQKQWLRNQKQVAYQKFAALVQVNARTVYLGMSEDKFAENLELEDTRMKAYWELHVVASRKVSEEAYRYIHEYKAYISLLKQSDIATQALRRRLDNPDPEDSAEFLEGLRKFMKDNRMGGSGVAVGGYQLLMLQAHRLVDAMRADLGLPPVGTDDGETDLRSNPVENWLNEFQQSLPEGTFEAPRAEGMSEESMSTR